MEIKILPRSQGGNFIIMRKTWQGNFKSNSWRRRTSYYLSLFSLIIFVFILLGQKYLSNEYKTGLFLFNKGGDPTSAFPCSRIKGSIGSISIIPTVNAFQSNNNLNLITKHQRPKTKDWNRPDGSYCRNHKLLPLSSSNSFSSFSFTSCNTNKLKRFETQLTSVEEDGQNYHHLLRQAFGISSSYATEMRKIRKSYTYRKGKDRRHYASTLGDPGENDNTLLPESFESTIRQRNPMKTFLVRMFADDEREESFETESMKKKNHNQNQKGETSTTTTDLTTKAKVQALKKAQGKGSDKLKNANTPGFDPNDDNRNDDNDDGDDNDNNNDRDEKYEESNSKSDFGFGSKSQAPEFDMGNHNYIDTVGNTEEYVDIKKDDKVTKDIKTVSKKKKGKTNKGKIKNIDNTNKAETGITIVEDAKNILNNHKAIESYGNESSLRDFEASGFSSNPAFEETNNVDKDHKNQSLSLSVEDVNDKFQGASFSSIKNITTTKQRQQNQNQDQLPSNEDEELDSTFTEDHRVVQEYLRRQQERLRQKRSDNDIEENEILISEEKTTKSQGEEANSLDLPFYDRDIRYEDMSRHTEQRRRDKMKRMFSGIYDNVVFGANSFWDAVEKEIRESETSAANVNQDENYESPLLLQKNDGDEYENLPAGSVGGFNRSDQNISQRGEKVNSIESYLLGDTCEQDINEGTRQKSEFNLAKMNHAMEEEEGLVTKENKRAFNILSYLSQAISPQNQKDRQTTTYSSNTVTPNTGSLVTKTTSINNMPNSETVDVDELTETYAGANVGANVNVRQDEKETGYVIGEDGSAEIYEKKKSTSEGSFNWFGSSYNFLWEWSSSLTLQRKEENETEKLLQEGGENLMRETKGEEDFPILDTEAFLLNGIRGDRSKEINYSKSTEERVKEGHNVTIFENPSYTSYADSDIKLLEKYGIENLSRTRRFFLFFSRLNSPYTPITRQNLRLVSLYISMSIILRFKPLVSNLRTLLPRVPIIRLVPLTYFLFAKIYLTSRRYIDLYQTTRVPGFQLDNNESSSSSNNNREANSPLIFEHSSEKMANLNSNMAMMDMDITEFLISNGRFRDSTNGRISTESTSGNGWWWPFADPRNENGQFRGTTTTRAKNTAKKHERGRFNVYQNNDSRFKAKATSKATAKSNSKSKGGVENTYYMSLTPSLSESRKGKSKSTPSTKTRINEVKIDAFSSVKSASSFENRRDEDFLDSSQSGNGNSLLNSADNSWNVFSYFYPEKKNNQNINDNIDNNPDVGSLQTPTLALEHSNNNKNRNMDEVAMDASGTPNQKVGQATKLGKLSKIIPSNENWLPNSTILEEGELKSTNQGAMYSTSYFPSSSDSSPNLEEVDVKEKKKSSQQEAGKRKVSDSFDIEDTDFNSLSPSALNEDDELIQNDALLHSDNPVVNQGEEIKGTVFASGNDQVNNKRQTDNLSEASTSTKTKEVEIPFSNDKKVANTVQNIQDRKSPYLSGDPMKDILKNNIKESLGRKDGKSDMELKIWELQASLELENNTSFLKMIRSLANVEDLNIYLSEVGLEPFFQVTQDVLTKQKERESLTRHTCRKTIQEVKSIRNDYLSHLQLLTEAVEGMLKLLEDNDEGAAKEILISELLAHSATTLPLFKSILEMPYKIRMKNSIIAMGRINKKNIFRRLRLFIEEYFYPNSYKNRLHIYEEENKRESLLFQERNEVNEEFLLLRIQAVIVNILYHMLLQNNNPVADEAIEMVRQDKRVYHALQQILKERQFIDYNSVERKQVAHLQRSNYYTNVVHDVYVKSYALLSLLGYHKWKPRKGQKGLRILAMDGGGTRGVLSIALLKEIMSGVDGKVQDQFDIICGTSTGGILAALFACKQVSLGKAETLYDELITKIFTKTLTSFPNLVARTAQYSEVVWEDILHDLIQDTLLIESASREGFPRAFVLSSVLSCNPAKIYMWRNYNYKDSLPEEQKETSIAMNSVPPSTISNLKDNDKNKKSRIRRLFNRFRVRKNKDDSLMKDETSFSSRYDGTFRGKVKDALRATTAAPSYFYPYHIDGYTHSDGAILANNPTAIALHEAKVLYPGVPIELVVSIGTGKIVETQVERSLDVLMWGSILNQLINSSTNTETIHHTIKDLLPSNRYYRFNPEVENLSIDEVRPEKLRYLKNRAKEHMQDPEVQKSVAMLVDILNGKLNP